MTVLTKFKFFLWYFGHFRVPMIGYLRPKLLLLTDEKIVVKLPLGRRSKNHLNSMYFGSLAVGADLAGGFHGLYHAKKSKENISLVFKSFQAQFLKRPESDVYFVCEMGKAVSEMIVEAMQTKGRINNCIKVMAYTNYPNNCEEVAQFTLELSIKLIDLNTKTYL